MGSHAKSLFHGVSAVRPSWAINAFGAVMGYLDAAAIQERFTEDSLRARYRASAFQVPRSVLEESKTLQIGYEHVAVASSEANGE